MDKVTLVRLTKNDREQFIKDNQEAFNYGALEEFGRRDDHFEEEGEIISRSTIEKSIDSGEAYRIMQYGKPVGGLVIRTDGERGDLDLLFVSPHIHSKGIGFAAWCAVEKLHPEVTLWETVTPYFEKRNIPFKILKMINEKTFVGLLFSKSTVDYTGVYKNTHCEFEAKQTELETFNFNNIQQHQYLYLEKLSKY